MDLASGAVRPVGAGQRDATPAWSPDGQWLAFVASTEAGRKVHVVRADGSDLRALPNEHEWNSAPQWSPDGTRLAYTGSEGLESRIMVCDIARSSEAVWGGDQPGLMRPVWQDGSTLVAAGYVGEPGEVLTDLFTVKADETRPLTILPRERPYAEWSPAVHPTMTAIAFESNDGGDREIYVALGTSLFNLSNHRAADWNPSWTANGEWLCFESFREGRRGLYRVQPEALRIVTVAASPEYDNWAASWSPDGEHAVFVSNRTGDPELFLVTPREGESSVRQLTDHAGPDLAPAWRPGAKP